MAVAVVLAVVVEAAVVVAAVCQLEEGPVWRVCLLEAPDCDWEAAHSFSSERCRPDLVCET